LSSNQPKFHISILDPPGLWPLKGDNILALVSLLVQKLQADLIFRFRQTPVKPKPPGITRNNDCQRYGTSLTAVALPLKSPSMADQPKKKNKRRNLVTDWLAYVALRFLVLFLYLFDVQTNLNTACFLGRLLWRYYRRGRNRALDNLRASYPDKSEKWFWQTGRRSFEHIAMLAIDVIFAPRLAKRQNWRDYSRYKNVETAKWLMQQGRGLLMIAGHYANFEIIGYILGLFGFNVYSIARPLDNRFISRYLYGVRQRAGQNIIDKKGAAKLMDKILAEGATVCFIADQDAGRKGIFVDFFGRKASTYKSIGLLAITNKIPVGVGYSKRIGNRFFFEIGVQRLILPEEWADKEDPLTWITAEYTKAIEQIVREDPTQYWWLHRRWKHRPKEETQEAAHHV
jgi:KDO2-lipid IV(A) lauroyltransferase